MTVIAAAPSQIRVKRVEKAATVTAEPAPRLMANIKELTRGPQRSPTRRKKKISMSCYGQLQSRKDDSGCAKVSTIQALL